MNIFNWIKGLFAKKTGETVKTAVSSNLEIEKQIDMIVLISLTKPTNCQNMLNFNSNIKYWQAVIKAICSAESDFNPNESYYEDTMGYYSLGLMQLSYEDYEAYDFILDPNKNRLCEVELNIKLGMIILDKLIARHGAFEINNGNYWSTLEPKNKRHQDYLDAFNKYYVG